MQRSLIAVVATLIFAFQITVIVLGYAQYGQYPSLGTTTRLDGYHTQITQVNEAARAGGFHNGDVIDSRELPVSQRLATYWSFWKAGTVFATPVHRGTMVSTAQVRVTPVDDRWFTFGDVAIRLLFFALGVILIVRGSGDAGIWGGISVVGLALAPGYAFSWGNVPIAVGVAAFLVQSIAYIPSYFARLYFADALMPAGRRIPNALAIPFWIMLAFLVVLIVVRRVEALAGYAVADSSSAFQLAQLLLNVYFVVIFAYVASATANSGVRVLFWSYLAGSIGITTNSLVTILGLPPPFNGALNLTYAFYAAGFTYAVFAKRLVSVNFFVSRAAVYTIVLGFMIAIFVLLERLIEAAAIGKTPGLILELLVPLSLGLSFRWFEGYAERIVERVLFREKQYAQVALENLITDFPHARNVSTLERSVVDDVHRLMHARFAALYRESELGYQTVATSGDGTFPSVGEDDRAFVRMRSSLAPVVLERVHSELHGVLAFPLIVVGQVTGALVVGERAHSEPYDPDEVSLLTKLAHELAVTLLWAEREPLRMPSNTRLPTEVKR